MYNAILKKTPHCVLAARLEQSGKGRLFLASMHHGSKTRTLLPHAHWANLRFCSKHINYMLTLLVVNKALFSTKSVLR